MDPAGQAGRESKVIMKQLNIAICDDNEKICDYLEHKLLGYSIRNNLECSIDKFHNGQDLLDGLSRQTDLLFLDIEMEGINGMDTAKQLRRTNKNVLIVFLTAYDQFVFESFKVSAFQYLLKPLKDEDFTETMDAVCSQLFQPEDVFTFHFQNQIYSVRYHDILYIEVMRGKLFLYCDDQTYRYSGTLDEIESILADHDFYRIHRSYLINIGRIQSYDNNKIIMANGDEIPISKYRRNAFKESYISYWSKII